MKNEPANAPMRMLTGKGVSPGLAKGRAHVYIDMLQSDGDDYQIESGQIRGEQARIGRAIDDVRKCLIIDARQIEGKLCRNSADIFLAHEAMLLDPSVLENLNKVVETQQVNAGQAVRTVFKQIAGRFRKMNDEVLRDRGDDIEDLSRRLLRSLSGIHAHCLENLPANSVLVARRLLPSDTVFLSRLSTVAVLAEFA
jgi:phosphotransferase system enzyme I (PtsI)